MIAFGIIVQLKMNGDGILVLRLFDDKDHQKRNDRCTGIDYQLPGVWKFKNWPRQYPLDNEHERNNKGHRLSENPRDLIGQTIKKPRQC